MIVRKMQRGQGLSASVSRGVSLPRVSGCLLTWLLRPFRNFFCSRPDGHERKWKDCRHVKTHFAEKTQSLPCRITDVAIPWLTQPSCHPLEVQAVPNYSAILWKVFAHDCFTTTNAIQAQGNNKNGYKSCHPGTTQRAAPSRSSATRCR